MIDKIKALFYSRRFIAAVVGIVVAVLRELGIPITEETVQLIVTMLVGWIIGDSLQKTELPK